MDMATLRAATDAEFGLACYEPFGISPLEPLAAGAICLVSNICGCRWFAQEIAGGDPAPNVLIGDYIGWSAGGSSSGDQTGGKADSSAVGQSGQRQPAGAWTMERLLAIDAADRAALEERTAEKLAAQLHTALPRSEDDRLALLRRGAELAKGMSWDEVLRQHLLPTIDRALR